MNRVNLYLPEPLQRRLKQRAKMESTTASDLVRKFVEQGLNNKAQASKDWATRFQKIAEMKPKGSGPKGAVAVDHDYYLYGPGRIE